MFFRLEDNSVPSTMIVPDWCSSSLLMHLIKVDLPDPEGPQITMRSFSRTVRSISRSAWKKPNHLFMPLISIAMSPAAISLVVVPSAAFAELSAAASVAMLTIRSYRLSVCSLRSRYIE